jgi:hypothetical protein
LRRAAIDRSDARLASCVMCANVCSDDLLDAFTEDSPAPLVVVDKAGGIAAQVRCAVDEFGGGVKKPGEPSRPAHVDSHSCRGEVDVVEDVGGSTEEPGDEGARSWTSGPRGHAVCGRGAAARRQARGATSRRTSRARGGNGTGSGLRRATVCSDAGRRSRSSADLLGARAASDVGNERGVRGPLHCDVSAECGQGACDLIGVGVLDDQ